MVRLTLLTCSDKKLGLEFASSFPSSINMIIKSETFLSVPYKVFSRDEAHDIFLHLMENAALRKGRREIAYKAVRTGAESSWRLQ